MGRPDPPAPAAWVVGNDVVDTADPRLLGKHADPRFLGRVLAEVEREAILGDPDPAGALWLCWAAKEAAYKVVSKVRGAPPPFVHRDFVVEAGPAGEAGVVRWHDLGLPFRVVRREQPLHLVAVAPALQAWPGGAGGPRLETGTAPAPSPTRKPDSDWESFLSESFSDRERAAVHGPASAQVRLGARSHLARFLGVEEERLEIVCPGGRPGRSPPVALLDGDPAPADVSLSHHGRWVGWAILAASV